MLLQLTVDVGDQDAATRSDIAALLGEALTEALRRGHTGELHTVDLTAVQDIPTETTDMARARGYGEGFRDGWDHCEKAMHPSPVLLATPTEDDQRAIAKAMDDLKRMSIPESTIDNFERARAEGALGGQWSEPVGPRPSIAASMYSVDPANGGALLTFPASMPAPADHPRHLLGEPAPAAPLETTAVLPAYDDGLPKTLEGMQATVQGAQHSYLTEPSGSYRPTGKRPKAGPGAPVSAYDMLTPETAHNDYGFPRHPGDRNEHTDSEGGLWRFEGVPNRQWERLTYPDDWGPVATGEFPSVHIAVE